MAIVVYHCTRDRNAVIASQDIAALSERLQPEGIAYAPPYVVVEDGLTVGVINPATSLPMEGMSVCLGGLFNGGDRWSRVGSKIPDGTNALYRANSDAIEIATDAVASRTVWYFHDKEYFCASSSQRALIYLLGNHYPNGESFAWMLGTGTLGIDGGWDARFRRLDADSVLSLDRRAWSLAVTTAAALSFDQPALAETGLKDLLAESIDAAIASIDVDMANWVLPLSGGYDSRALLQVLSQQRKIRTVTWGSTASRNQEASDAWVADKLATHFQTDHSFHALQPEQIAPEVLLGRYINHGEGRLDNISGYMDGFALWRELYRAGYEGIIRGDEMFGSIARRSAAQLFADWNFVPLQDYPNLPGITEALDLPHVECPARVAKRATETMSAYAERFYVQFYCATMLAGLNDLKARYCEVINPLLSRKVLAITARLPAHLRADKVLFKQIVAERTPGIGFATVHAITSKAQLIRIPAIAGHLLDYLVDYDGTLLPRSGVQAVVKLARSELQKDPPTRLAAMTARLRRKARRDIFRQADVPYLDPMLLGLRIYLALKTHELLTADATAMRDIRSTRRN